MLCTATKDVSEWLFFCYQLTQIVLDKVLLWGPTKSHPEPSGAVWTPPIAIRTLPGHCLDAVWISHCNVVLRFAIYSRISFCITWSDTIFSFFPCLSHTWQNEGTEQVVSMSFVCDLFLSERSTAELRAGSGQLRATSGRFRPDGSGRLLVGPLLCVLLQTIIPHCCTMYVEVAYCYRRSSMVSLSVCLHDCEPCKNC